MFVSEHKDGEVTLNLKVKQFLLFARFGLNDNQMRAMQFFGLLLALLGSIIALLKAFALL